MPELCNDCVPVMGYLFGMSDSKRYSANALIVTDIHACKVCQGSALSACKQGVWSIES